MGDHSISPQHRTPRTSLPPLLVADSLRRPPVRTDEGRPAFLWLTAAVVACAAAYDCASVRHIPACTPLTSRNTQMR